MRRPLARALPRATRHASVLALAFVAVGLPSRVRAQAAPVVSTAWVAERLRDPKLVLLHVGEKGEYDAEHLPGARLVALNDVSVSGPDNLPLEMPAPDDLRQRLEKLGISDDSHVVVYWGKDWVTPSSRILLTLDYAGLGARAHLLDGGLPQWKREGKPLTAEAPTVTPGRITAKVRDDLIVDHAFVQRVPSMPNTKLVDARPASGYNAAARAPYRAGHIPGAVNIPFTSVVDDSLRVRSRAELEQLFRAAGVKPGDTVTLYCYIGQYASAVALAAKIVGHPVKFYDGAFTDWSRRTELPVEGGPSGDR